MKATVTEDISDQKVLLPVHISPLWFEIKSKDIHKSDGRY